MSYHIINTLRVFFILAFCFLILSETLFYAEVFISFCLRSDERIQICMKHHKDHVFIPPIINICCIAAYYYLLRYDGALRTFPILILIYAKVLCRIWLFYFYHVYQLVFIVMYYCVAVYQFREKYEFKDKYQFKKQI